MKASMYDEAYKVYKKRLCITEKLYAKESENYVECLLDLALSLHYLGRINEMQSYISQARELARHISFSNKGGYASFCINVLCLWKMLIALKLLWLLKSVSQF